MKHLLLLLLSTLPGTNSQSRVTAFEGRSVTVQCPYAPPYTEAVKYWCKGTCQQKKRSDEAQKADDKVLLKDNKSQGVFTVTISRLEEEDEGWYRCGAVPGYYSEVSVFIAVNHGSSSLSVVSKSVTKQEKQTLAVHCHYDQYYRSYVKYWCKGDNWHYCSSLKRTDSPETPGDKITISDDQTRGVFTVTMRGLEKEDAGWYWCAIEKLWSDLGISLNLTVVDGK
ncbi:CMRF35-like molecule 3 [Acipenser oxyrinchus oxyrinchus]|uniref:CMRF35-like molecule 3 n=1 Tax=Acipenser oxyrinchus oxyrinchus TaxID=40147 RepID=A0AAD8LRE2_ACIOX|nr:CMRF35-like molecule 3 [Acipenser oxyrinchus oxyrinchus]